MQPWIKRLPRKVEHIFNMGHSANSSALRSLPALSGCWSGGILGCQPDPSEGILGLDHAVLLVGFGEDPCDAASKLRVIPVQQQVPVFFFLFLSCKIISNNSYFPLKQQRGWIVFSAFSKPPGTCPEKDQSLVVAARLRKPVRVTDRACHA